MLRWWGWCLVCVLTRVPLGTTDIGRNTNPTESGVGNWATWGVLSTPDNVLWKTPSVCNFGHMSCRNVQCCFWGCQVVLASALAWLRVKPSFLARTAGVRRCWLAVSSCFSNYSPKVCRWGFGILSTPISTVPLSFNKLQLGVRQKDVQVPGCNLCSVCVFMLSWCLPTELRDNWPLSWEKARSWSLHLQPPWGKRGFLPIKTPILFH